MYLFNREFFTFMKNWKKTLKKVAHNRPKPYYSTVQPRSTAHSPKLIFHIMKSRDQRSVLLSVEASIHQHSFLWGSCEIYSHKKIRVLDYYFINVLVPMCSFFFFLVRLVSWVELVKGETWGPKDQRTFVEDVRARLSKHTWEWLERTFSYSHYTVKEF